MDGFNHFAKGAEEWLRNSLAGQHNKEVKVIVGNSEKEYTAGMKNDIMERRSEQFSRGYRYVATIVTPTGHFVSKYFHTSVEYKTFRSENVCLPASSGEISESGALYQK